MISHHPLRGVIALALLTQLLLACGGGEALPDTPSADASTAVTGAAPGTADSHKTALAMKPSLDIRRDIVVMLASGVEPNAFAATYRMRLLDRFGKRPIYRFQLFSEAAIERTLVRLRADPRVRFAERNALSESPEGRWDVVWAVGGSAAEWQAQWAPEALGLAEAHTLSSGAGVRVALLDTGIDLAHPTLAPQLLRDGAGRVVGRDFVDDDGDPSEAGSPADAGWGHGTHVAGLVMLAAPSASLLPVRVLDAAGRGNVWVLAEALMYAVDPDGDPNTDDGAHIVNMSLGTTSKTTLLDLAVELATCSDDDDSEIDVDLSDPGFADDHARCNLRRGAVVMAAAGNAGNATELQYPAAEGAEGQLAITATAVAGGLAPFSNRGAWVQLAAPGERLISTMPGGQWATWSGTSMATPLASGVAALVLARTPDWKPVDVTKRLLDRSRSLCGSPIPALDAWAAVSDHTPDPLPC